MTLLPKKTIRQVAIVFISLFLACAIISIILAGISYQFAGPDWKPSPWSTTPGLQIASVIYAIFIALIGYAVFLKPTIGGTITYTVFLLLSIIFTFSIAVMCLVAGNHGFVNTYFGCNGKFSGMLELWQGVDAYLQRVDQALCSKNCPCTFTNSIPFSTNTTVAPYYNKWTKTETFGNSAFQNCTVQTQRGVYDQAVKDDSLFDPLKNFDTNNFASYMARVENKFQCAGWCNVTYYDTNNNSSAIMYKGPVVRLGCLDQVINWLPPYLNAWGSVMMVMAAFQIIVLVMSICHCWAREKDHELEVPHFNTEERREMNKN